MRKILLLFAAAAVCGYANASTEWTISGTQFRVDTLYHANIGPGTTQTEIKMTCLAEGNNYVNRIFYTTVDLTNDNVEMRVVKGQDHMGKFETVSSMAKRKTAEGNGDYFAGVNGDFFGSYPISTCISNGSLTNFRIESDINHPCSFIMSDKKVPVIADSIEGVARNAKGNVTFPDNTQYPFEFNDQRWTDELIVYTYQYMFNEDKGAHRSGQNEWGAETQIRPVENATMFGQDGVYEVMCAPTPSGTGGNMEIPADGFVLSGHGNAAKLVTALKVGDKIKINMPFSADGKPIVAKEVIGGFPVILRNGEVLSRPAYPEHLSSRQPRTAVGYNSDKTKVIMAVVDGRNAGVSEGLYTHILAGVMLNLGCVDAMNFDGGGSSTSYVQNLGVRNTPCNTGNAERTVTNGLFAVSTAPADDVITSIEIADKAVNLNAGDKYTPVVYGYNKYGVLVNANLAGFHINTAPEIGTVDGGTITIGSGKYNTTMTVWYEGLSYTIPVYTNGGGTYVSEVIEINTNEVDYTPEYYTLQGIKVTNPQKGQVVIVRKAGIVYKEIVK
ncbi:MAG: phosphodiester glycosidase family protein [Muribaculaceae bacterium]|nr:phosphodiester glycosidase family protein [Muribaculaceae bacterium]